MKNKEFNSTDYTNAPLQLQKSYEIKAQINEVWKIIADHEGMTSWMPFISHVNLVRKGEDGDWGQGCERHCQFGPDLLQEKIVFWDSPYGYAYSIADMHLVKNHVGFISLESHGETTKVTWQQYFVPNGNIIKNFIAKRIMMPNVMSKALKNLNKKLAA